MITVGLSQHEIDRIVKILEEHSAEYHVDAAGGSSSDTKVRAGRGDTSFYQIEIPQTEYDKLPASAKSKLENLGIYPEMEAPNFDEVHEVPHVPSDATKVRKNFKKIEKALMLVFALMISLGFMYQALN